MNIDRNNYEEYFVLYMDNELSAKERKLVEEFVRSNPDLEEELVMMKQSKFLPDRSIVFDRKDLLKKEEDSHSINFSNYEEYFILYTDNELTDDERNQVEKFVALNSGINKEFLLFQKTRLQPEEGVIFPNKSSLYKKENDKRVIPMRWWKVAIAASLIFAAGITTFVVVKKNLSKTPGDVVVIRDTKLNDTKTPPAKVNVNPPNIAVTSDKTKSNILQNTKIQNPLPERYAEIKKDRKNKISKEQKIETVFATVDLPEKTNEPLRSNKPESTVVDANTGTANNKKPSQQIINKPRVTTEDTTPYNQTEPVYASNDESKNKKLRGFFRKATRIFERATNINPVDDDNKLLVGSFAINLK